MIKPQIELIKAGYNRGYEDCALKIYITIKTEMEKNKETDWKSCLAILEKHLTNKENK